MTSKLRVKNEHIINLTNKLKTGHLNLPTKAQMAKNLMKILSTVKALAKNLKRRGTLP